jgi:hypothetical protein
MAAGVNTLSTLLSAMRRIAEVLLLAAIVIFGAVIRFGGLAVPVSGSTRSSITTSPRS